MTVPTTGARYHFPCQRWLARDRGDRKLVVEFTPTSVQEFGMFLSLSAVFLVLLVLLFIYHVFLIFCLFVSWTMF